MRKTKIEKADSISDLSISFARVFIMNVFRDIQDIPAFPNPVITIGSFDGLHTGHQQILKQLKDEAAAVNGSSVVITFFPHPKMILGKSGAPLQVLTTLEEKISLLAASGIDNLVVIPFTESFAGLSAENYVSDFLVRIFRPHTIILGYDHRFGKDRCGDYQLLESKAPEFGFVVKEIPAHVLDSITVSSTSIRNTISQGDVTAANQLLGYHYFFSGTVVKGNQMGRKLGFPTANIQPADESKLLPADGVYAVEITIKERKDTYRGMMNIGIRPTFNLHQRVIEVNIFELDEDIYGQTLTVYLKKRIRSEMKFTGPEALIKQLESDKENALKD